MTIWKLVRLNFDRSPAHFGELGIGLEKTSERVRSDTLFSAWVSSYARIFKNPGIETLLQQFPTADQPNLTPPFRLSSTFIYRQQGGDYIYYLPRPSVKPPKSSQEIDFTQIKTIKKLRYLPLEMWRNWYQLGTVGEENYEDLLKEYSLAFKIGQPVPKVAVDRTTRATNFYQTGFVQFNWEKNQSGLYFIINFPQKNDELENQLYAALELLGDEGLGGERSSGAGQFQPEWLEISDTWEQVLDFSQQTHHALISVFWDDNLEGLITDKTSYEIIERGGWISSSPYGHQKRRKMVRMFAEGSVFPIPPQGKLADVTPPGFKELHSVYRSGISLSLPIKVSE